MADIFDARSFGSPYTAPRLSPRGGATIALPFHGVIYHGSRVRHLWRLRHGALWKGQNYCLRLHF